ncbi:MAG: hypothetical protein ACE5OZ_17405 [Candidatus Heimdallarchaeota archaeon]
MTVTQEYAFNIANISDAEILTHLNQRDNVTTISFVSPFTDIPHMCPVWCVFVNGKVYFQSDDHTWKVKAIEKGNNQVGLSVMDPRWFPDYVEGSIPYISLGGPATIRTKEEFADFEEIIKLIFLKYVEDDAERIKLMNIVMNELKGRILIEVLPKWFKVIKVPNNQK